MKFPFRYVITLIVACHTLIITKADPTIKITINHPPSLGIKVSKIAFGNSEGECSDQIIDAIIADFVSNQMEVIDRAHLNSILEEHNLTFSGYIDGTSAANIGKILGPSAMIFVKVQRCTTYTTRLYDDRKLYDYSTSTSYVKRYYISKTTVNLKGSVQTVDLTSGRIFGAQSFEFSPEQSYESDKGYPEFPSSFDLMDRAMAAAVYKVHKLFLPWTEHKELVFFDDRAHGLREASLAMQASDYNRAYSNTVASINSCLAEGKSTGKVISHGYYNLGVIHMVQDNLDSALHYFRIASQAKPEPLYNEAIAETMEAMETNKAMQKYEKTLAMPAIASNSAGNAGSGNILTNKDIISLTKSKLSDGLIVQKIKLSKCKFDTSADALIELTNAGVNEEVLKAMMEKN